MSERAVHVVFRNRRWAVLRQGVDEPLSYHDRKVEAARAGLLLAERDNVQLVVFPFAEAPRSLTPEAL